MRKSRHIFVLTLALSAASVICAWAAGYQKVPISGQPAATSGEKAGTVSGFVDAVKEASFYEKVPPMLDDAAASVKAILGQFGLSVPRNP